MKAFCIGLIGLTTLPLLVYPFVLMANVMSLAASPPSSQVPLSLRLAMSGFIWSSTIYPLPYLVTMIASIVLLRLDEVKKALWWQVGLLGYLLLVGLFFVAWLALG